MPVRLYPSPSPSPPSREKLEFHSLRPLATVPSCSTHDTLQINVCVCECVTPCRLCVCDTLQIMSVWHPADYVCVLCVFGMCSCARGCVGASLQGDLQRTVHILNVQRVHCTVHSAYSWTMHTHHPAVYSAQSTDDLPNYITLAIPPLKSVCNKQIGLHAHFWSRGLVYSCQCPYCCLN